MSVSAEIVESVLQFLESSFFSHLSRGCEILSIGSASNFIPNHVPSMKIDQDEPNEIFQQQISWLMTCTILVAHWRDRNMNHTFMESLSKISNGGLVLLTNNVEHIAQNFVQNDPLISKPIIVIQNKTDDSANLFWYCNPKDQRYERYEQALVLSGVIKKSNDDKRKIYTTPKQWHSACNHHLSNRQVNVSYLNILPYSYL